MARQGQDGLDKAEQALADLLAKCDEDAEHALAVFIVCISLMRQLSIDRPLAERQIWALELYRLADALAENEELSSPTDGEL